MQEAWEGVVDSIWFSAAITGKKPQRGESPRRQLALATD
jgi:hypothetical protein